MSNAINRKLSASQRDSSVIDRRNQSNKPPNDQSINSSDDQSIKSSKNSSKYKANEVNHRSNSTNQTIDSIDESDNDETEVNELHHSIQRNPMSVPQTRHQARLADKSVKQRDQNNQSIARSFNQMKSAEMMAIRTNILETQGVNNADSIQTNQFVNQYDVNIDKCGDIDSDDMLLSQIPPGPKKRSIGQSTNHSIDASSDNIDADEAYRLAQLSLLENEKKREVNQLNEQDEGDLDSNSDINRICESPLVTSRRNNQAANQSINQADDEVELNLSDTASNQAIDQSNNPAISALLSNPPLGDNGAVDQPINEQANRQNGDGINGPQPAKRAPNQSIKLKLKTRTIPAEWAAEEGCQPTTSSNSFVLSLKHTSDEGKRFINCSSAFHSFNGAVQRLNIGKYLSILMHVPYIPLEVAHADDVDAAFVALQLKYNSDPVNQSINQWIDRVKNDFIQPIEQSISATCKHPPVEPTSHSDASLPITIPKALMWANLLTDSTAALINRNDQTDRNNISFKLCFRNSLACNLAIARINELLTLKLNPPFVADYQRISNQQLARPANDGFQLVVSRSFISKATLPSTILSQLSQPIMPAFDKADHGTTHITSMPSSLFHLDISISTLKQRFVRCRVEGFALNPSNHPYAATNTTINQPSQIDDIDALDSLKTFLLYHPTLQTPATAISFPPHYHKHDRKLGVCFVTTPQDSVFTLQGVLSHWKKSNQSINQSDQFLTNLSIDIPKEGIRICEFCQTPGHHKSNCIALLSPNTGLHDSNNQPISLCQRCRTPGTPNHACVTLSSVKCLICNQSGHTSSDCQFGKRCWATVVGRPKNAPNPNRAINRPKQSINQSSSINRPVQQAANSVQPPQPVPPTPSREELLQVLREEAQSSHMAMMQQMQESFNQSLKLMYEQIKQVQQLVSIILPLAIPTTVAQSVSQHQPVVISSPPSIQASLSSGISSAASSMPNQPAINPAPIPQSQPHLDADKQAMEKQINDLIQLILINPSVLSVLRSRLSIVMPQQSQSQSSSHGL